MSLDNATRTVTLFCLAGIFSWFAPIGPSHDIQRCPASKLRNCMNSAKNILVQLPKKSYDKVSKYFQTLDEKLIQSESYLKIRSEMYKKFEKGDYTPFHPENLKTPEQFLSFISIALEQEGKAFELKFHQLNLYRRWRASVNMKTLIEGGFDRSDYELYLMTFLEHLNGGKFSFLNTLVKNPYTKKGKKNLLTHLGEEQMLFLFLERYKEFFAKNGPIKRLQSKMGKKLMPIPNFTINLFFNALIWDFLPIKYPVVAFFYDANRPHLINGNYGLIGARERYNFWKTYVAPAMFVYFLYSASNPSEEKLKELEEQQKILDKAAEKIEERVNKLEEITHDMKSILKTEDDEWAFKCSLFVKCLELHKSSSFNLPRKDSEFFEKCLSWLVPELRPYCSEF